MVIHQQLPLDIQNAGSTLSVKLNILTLHKLAKLKIGVNTQNSYPLCSIILRMVVTNYVRSIFCACHSKFSMLGVCV